MLILEVKMVEAMEFNIHSKEGAKYAGMPVVCHTMDLGITWIFHGNDLANMTHITITEGNKWDQKALAKVDGPRASSRSCASNSGSTPRASCGRPRRRRATPLRARPTARRRRPSTCTRRSSRTSTSGRGSRARMLTGSSAGRRWGASGRSTRGCSTSWRTRTASGSAARCK